MDRTVLSISSAENKSIKEKIKICFGRMCSMLFVKRSMQLAIAPTSYPTGIKDKLLMAFLREKARQSNDSNFFELLHSDFWQGSGGTVFSENCDHRFEDLFLNLQSEDLKVLFDEWEGSSCDKIIEIGCCSGQHLQYLTTQLIDVQSAIGIDLNAEQIQTNIDNARFDKRISFHCADGFDWLINKAKPNTLFVTNGGVFEYFSQERLEEILQFVKSNLSPAMFFTVEPIASDHDMSTRNESIPFGEELSFSHNYEHLFKSNGYTIKHQRWVDFDTWRMMVTIAVC